MTNPSCSLVPSPDYHWIIAGSVQLEERFDFRLHEVVGNFIVT